MARELQINYAGGDWLALKLWLQQQKATKVQLLLKVDTDARQVENIRGSLQFIDMLLNQERGAALRSEE